MLLMLRQDGRRKLEVELSAFPPPELLAGCAADDGRDCWSLPKARALYTYIQYMQQNIKTCGLCLDLDRLHRLSRLEDPHLKSAKEFPVLTIRSSADVEASQRFHWHRLISEIALATGYDLVAHHLFFISFFLAGSLAVSSRRISGSCRLLGQYHYCAKKLRDRNQRQPNQGGHSLSLLRGARQHYSKQQKQNSH
jgi:hypothetical protein